MRSINRAVFQYQQLNRAGRCNQCRCQILRRRRLEILSAYWLCSTEHPVHSSQQLPPRPAALLVLRLQRRTAPLCPFERNLPHNRCNQNQLPRRSERLPRRPAMCIRIRPSFFQGLHVQLHYRLNLERMPQWSSVLSFITRSPFDLCGFTIGMPGSVPTRLHCLRAATC